MALWCGAGIAQEYPRPSHAVVAGCGAAVEGGWECVALRVEWPWQGGRPATAARS